MITKEYPLHAPQKLEEAVALLQHGEDAKLLAGGVSLVPLITLGLVQPEALISLNHIRELEKTAIT